MSARPAEKVSIAVAQLNSTVGDIGGNVEKVRVARATAAAQGADIVVFPELFIAGYPPEDLVLKPAFQACCRSAIEALARETSADGPALLVGTPWLDASKLYNAVALLEGGAIAALRYKVDLPNYGVFDEKRVFAPGPMPGPVNFRGVRLGEIGLQGKRALRRGPPIVSCLGVHQEPVGLGDGQQRPRAGIPRIDLDGALA